MTLLMTTVAINSELSGLQVLVLIVMVIVQNATWSSCDMHVSRYTCNALIQTEMCYRVQAHLLTLQNTFLEQLLHGQLAH